MPTIRLSEHFTLLELTASQTAELQGIDNTPSAAIIFTMTNELAPLLEKVRKAVREPGTERLVRVTSGYRCLALNRALRSKDTSQHVLGEAADIQIDGMTPHEVCAKIVSAGIKFGQLIEESNAFGARWTHISVPTPTIHDQMLTIDANGTRAGFG